MKLQILSDIHVDIAHDKGKALIRSMKPEGIDILILAGDILNLKFYSEAKEIFDRIFEQGYKKVIYLPGNHDFWYNDLDHGHWVSTSLEEAYKGTFHYLHSGKILEIEGKRFLGDIMWFSQIKNTYRRKTLQRGFPDFSLIKEADPGVYDKHRAFRAFLEKELKEGDIVVTHHLPSFKSTPDRFVNDPTNVFFASNMEDIILEKKPKLWIHGHTHDVFDYNIGQTRIICNPQDYPSKHNNRAKHFEIVV